MDYKNIITTKLDKHRGNPCIRCIWIIGIVIIFFTMACGETRVLQETKAVVASLPPLPSPKLEETDLPPTTLEPEEMETIVPSPTGESVETTSTSKANIDSVEGMHAMVKEQLTQSNGGYFILQFNDFPPDQDTQSKLKASNVILFDHIPESAYYAYLPPESLSTLEELLQIGVLRQVDPIPNSDKLEAGLLEKMQADPQQDIAVIVQFFEEPSATDQKNLEALLELSAYSFGPVNFAEGTVAAKDIEKILSLSFVKWVEEQLVNQLFEE